MHLIQRPDIDILYQAEDMFLDVSRCVKMYVTSKGRYVSHIDIFNMYLTLSHLRNHIFVIVFLLSSIHGLKWSYKKYG